MDTKFPDAKRSGSEIGLLISHTGIDESKSIESLTNPESKNNTFATQFVSITRLLAFGTLTHTLQVGDMFAKH
ncbi:MAG: hypothetical protein C4B59_13335 [Candidatus Methanogaster sp.]|uniref:Uncharacterized protein n=1 Tax=Candidatus Methanogaster sp. TaxID=3386292 RepID=A0AC61KZV6_9EURY|nr:MAG: hypothetical protein C4B59_13335 [ANME-2 cluster archaeon]